MILKKEIVWGGRTLTLETGKLAQQADGSVLVTYGDTVVLCTVVANKKPMEGCDFFPLTVNYIEKAYASGKIPGGFLKREGRPSERETLVSRLIDRPIRPLFHENFKNETQVVCTVLSFDSKNDSDVISIIGASAALTISGIPFLGPIAAARVGYKDGEFILNPIFDEEASDLDLVIAGTNRGVLMVESGAKELSEKEMLDAIKFGHSSMQPVIDTIIALAQGSAKEPWAVEECANDCEIAITSEIESKFMSDIEEAYSHKVKQDRYAALDRVFDKATAYFEKKHEADIDNMPSKDLLSAAFERVKSNYMRNKLSKTGKRIDGRTSKDIRDINIEVSVLPKTHGSALFMRGETQALAVATLGTGQDEQLIDSLGGEYKERFLLHYNFPPFSVGEIGRLGAPGRREIGHGRLAWRAIGAVLPEKDAFPYSIRIVSEILSCNGSSSMATVCGSSLALMDAGVPIKSAVAGIAMGLITNGKEYTILSDIMGEEDHLGDMDFKVAGTENGITALQMDIKVTSVTFDIMKSALEQAHEGRKHILSKMTAIISEHRAEVSANAPKIVHITIPKDKIREVIGSGGKVIREIIETTGVKIDIDDDGNVNVAGVDSESIEKALYMIRSIALDPIVGEIYPSKVVKIMDFGAFVNFYGTREGLVHISEISDKRLESVDEVLNEGDSVNVKFLGYDNKGRAKLTMKI